MRYVYKQLLAFLCIIVITVFLTGMLFIQFIVRNVYEEKENQLFGYAESVVDANMTTAELEAGMNLISRQDVLIALYNAEDKLIYPVENSTYSSGLSASELAQLREGERLSLSHRDKGFMNENMSIVTVYLPLFRTQTGEFSGFIAVASPISGIEADIADIQKHAFLTILIVSGIAVLLSIAFANHLSKRIIRMRTATKEIAQGNYDISLPDHGKDEFDALSHDFNKMAQSLQSSHVEIERQENLRRQFMMDVAHEMRTPLTTINGILEGFLHGMIPEQRKERSLTLVHNETKRMIRMVNENLDYEKIRSNQFSLVKQVFSAKQALQSVSEQLQGVAAEKNNQITTYAEDTVQIYADYDRFIQILVNLVTNAIQFTENGSIHLEATSGTDATVVSVRDTGMGIDVKELKSIWERFYKVDVSRKSNQFGESGIGLAIVKSLVESHDGTIQVASVVGEGTTFTITLPNKKAENA